MQRHGPANSGASAVERYLRGKFGAALDAVCAELQQFAACFPPERLNREGFHLNEQLRPEVPAGERGRVRRACSIWSGFARW